MILIVSVSLVHPVAASRFIVIITTTYTIVPEAEVNTGEYSLAYKPRRSRGLYN